MLNLPDCSGAVGPRCACAASPRSTPARTLLPAPTHTNRLHSQLRKNPAARNFSKCQKKTESQIFSKFLEPIFPDFLKSLWDTWRTSSLSRNWKKFKIQCNSFMENQKLHCFFNYAIHIMFFNGNTNLKTTKKRGQTYSTSNMFFSHLWKSKNSFHHFSFFLLKKNIWNTEKVPVGSLYINKTHSNLLIGGGVGNKQLLKCQQFQRKIWIFFQCLSKTTRFLSWKFKNSPIIIESTNFFRQLQSYPNVV